MPAIARSASGGIDAILRDLRPLLLCAACLVVAGITAWSTVYWVTIGQYIKSTDDAYVGGEITPLSFRVAGVIETVAVADNQAVKAGDLLLKLDDRDYRVQLARAEATVAARRAALVTADAARALRVSMLGQTRSDLAAAMAEQVRPKIEVVRYRTGNDRGAPRPRPDQPDPDGEKAGSTERKAQAALAVAEHQLEMVDAQREQAQAELDQAIADRDLARLNLSYTEIRAPIDGVVGNRSARVGAYATVGAPMLAIVPARGLWVDANFKESQVAAMRVGETVEIAADAVPGTVLRGRVASLSPATGAQFSLIPPENATGNFTKIVQRVPVRIVLDDDAGELGRLRPGLSVVVRVDARPGTDALADGRPNISARREKTAARAPGLPAPPHLDARQ